MYKLTISADNLLNIRSTREVVVCDDEGHEIHMEVLRKAGHWTKYREAEWRCSECGKIQIADDVNELNYCATCGAKMEIWYE